MRSSVSLRVLLCLTLACSMAVMAPPEAEAGGSAWHWLNPLPRGETLNDLAIAPDNASWAYAVGNIGCVMKTTDGGASWHLKTPPPPSNPSLPIPNLYTVSVISASTAWVAGENGYVARTTDHGSSWTLQDSKLDGTVTDIFFLNQWEGWACSNTGKIAYTVDGGSSWTVSADVFPAVYFQALCFTSDTDGFAVAAGAVYKTTNGGIDWVATHTWAGDYPMDIAFMPGNANIGWAVCFTPSSTGNSAYRTSNHGVTWEPVDIGYGMWSSVCINADGTVWVAGSGNQPKRLAKFTDAATPDVAEMAYGPYSSPSLNALDCSSSSSVLAVGGAGTIVRTGDSGASWSPRSSITQTNFYDVQFIDLHTGYACTDAGKVWKTNDAGVTWTTTGLDAGVLLYELYFLDAYTGWTVGAGGRVYKTVNGGASWTQQTSNTTDELYGVHFTDANNGWAVGQGGRLLSTSDGGTTWAATTRGTKDLYDIDFFGALDGAMVGADGTVYRTNDAGAWWDATAPIGTVTADMYAVEMIDETHFYIGGENYTHPVFGYNVTMLRTNDDGNGWSPGDWLHPAQFTYHSTIWDIQYADLDHGWVAFGDGYVGKTTDTGFTWEYSRASDDRFLGLTQVNGYVWGVGVGGKIMSTFWSDPTTVYRFYHKSNGTHFYTKSLSEKQSVEANLAHVYKYEGTGYSYDAGSAPDSLHRFYNFRNGTHFYTADPSEYLNTLNNLGHTYTYDGPAYNVSRTATSRTVWRFFNKRVGSHFYTANPDEKAFVQANLDATFEYEGPGFYLPE